MADDDVLAERLKGRMVLNDDRWDSHRREHDREREATITATAALEARLAALNEFRQQLGDQSKSFVTRELHDALGAEVERRVTAVSADIDRRFEESRRTIAALQANTNRLEGALAIARFVGIGGLVAGVIAIARANGLIWMKPYVRRKRLEAIFRNRRWAQFGQTHDKSTANGREGCTHTVLQALIYLWTGEEVTHDEVSAATGYTAGDVGMNSRHVDRAIAYWHLPYQATFRMDRPPTTDGLIQTVRNLGPALIAVDYGLYPLDRSLGGPNTAIRGGRNDLGFDGNHAVCLFAVRWLRKQREYRPRLMDPDHGSPARPAIPDFDAITDRQLARMWRANLSGKSYGQFGYLPTKEWEGVPQ